jgi:hypothetical protein
MPGTIFFEIQPVYDKGQAQRLSGCPDAGFIGIRLGGAKLMIDMADDQFPVPMVGLIDGVQQI